MKKKLIMVVPVLLIAAVGYKMFLAPKPIPPKRKIAGAVVPLGKDFLVNLKNGQYAKLSVALVMKPTFVAPVAEGSGGIALEQDAAIRAAITDTLTGLPGDDLVSRLGRHKVLEEIAKSIEKTTDEEVARVIFTDLTVQ
jgi:flagellar FliL protein